jgi:hypothetical protein
MEKMKKLFGLGLALLLAGCGEQGAVSAIEANGFTNVKLTGFVWWGCGQDDSFLYNTNFEANGVNGKHIHGFACGGMFKGWTVRID